MKSFIPVERLDRNTLIKINEHIKTNIHSIKRLNLFILTPIRTQL